MLKALTFRRSRPDVHAHGKKHDDSASGSVAWRAGRRRPRSSSGGASNNNYPLAGGGNHKGSVRRRGGPSAVKSPWQRYEVGDIAMERRRSSRSSMGGNSHGGDSHRSDNNDESITREDLEVALDDSASISDASYAVRAASIAFSTGSAADAAGEVALMAAAGELSGQSLKGAQGGVAAENPGGSAVYGGGKSRNDYPADEGAWALKQSYRSHIKAIQSGELFERICSDHSGSDADAAAVAKVAERMGGKNSATQSTGEPSGKTTQKQKKRTSGIGLRNFSSILSTEDEVERSQHSVSGLSARNSNCSLTGAMRDVLESDSSHSGAIGIEGKDAAYRRRQRRGKRSGNKRRAQKVCVALAAISAIVGAVLALVLPKDSPAVINAKAEARHAAEDLGLALKVIVSGREAAGLPVDHDDRQTIDEGEGAAAAEGGGEVRDRDLEMDPKRRHRVVHPRPLVRGADGDIDDAVRDQAVRDGRDVKMRALERLHMPVGEVFGGPSGGENAAAASGNPNVLPPLEAYNTASGPNDSGIYIPTFTSRNYADVWTPVNRMDVPMYWHIPKSGGTTVQDVLGHCLGMVQASDLASHDEVLAKRLRRSLDILTNKDGLRYVNVDASTVEGLETAKRLGLASSGKADVIITHRLHDVSSIFDVSHRGRAFALFRHPVKRASSMFYYLRGATWEPTYDESLGDMSLLEYAESDRAEENWVVRSLTNEFEEPLGAQHVEVAKEILRRKVLVGIMEEFDRSVVRFEQYFGWWGGVANDANVLRCQRERMSGGDNRNDHPKVRPGTEEYLALARKNWADVELYNYAKELFEEQASLV